MCEYECVVCGVQSEEEEDFTFIHYWYSGIRGREQGSGYFCLDDGFLLEVRTNYCYDCVVAVIQGESMCVFHKEDEEENGVVWGENKEDEGYDVWK